MTKMAIIAFLLICHPGCSQPVAKVQMTTAVKLLIEKLASNDSTGIQGLYDQKRNLDRARDYLPYACELFQKIIKKYGIPSTDRLVFEKEYNGGDKLSITLMNQEDSVLNLSRCDLIVWFYPGKSPEEASKFTNFFISFTHLVIPAQRPH